MQASLSFVRLSLLLLAIASISAAHGQSEWAFQSDGLVAYYPFFDGSLLDWQTELSVDHRDNAQQTNAVLTSDRFGQTNNAFYLNATNHRLIFTSGTNLPVGDSPVTMALWIKPDRISASPVRSEPIITYGVFGGYSPVNGFRIYLNSNGALGSDFGRQRVYATPTSLPDGKWHSIAFVLATNIQVSAYLDAKPLTFLVSPPPPTTLDFQRSLLVIGYYNGSYFDGAVSDVRIYNRALSADEIAALYQIESSPLPQLNIGKAVRVDMNTKVGVKYQLQVSNDLDQWTDYRAAFIADTPTQSQYFDVSDYGQYYRLVVLQDVGKATAALAGIAVSELGVQLESPDGAISRKALSLAELPQRSQVGVVGARQN